MIRVSGKFVIGAFWQTENNCVAIGVIKSAIIRFGIQRVFNVVYRGKYIDIKLKNGKKLIISNRELAFSFALCGFEFDDDVTDDVLFNNLRIYCYAVLCYCVMIKYIQKYGYFTEDGGKIRVKSFFDALKVLTYEGVCSDYAFNYLGLENYVTGSEQLRKSYLSQIKRKTGLLYNDWHAVVVSNGCYENYGTVRVLKRTIPHVLGVQMAYYSGF